MAATLLARFVDRVARSQADKALQEGFDILAAAALASEGHCASDTAGHARIIADLIEPGLAKLVRARRLYEARSEVR